MVISRLKAFAKHRMTRHLVDRIEYEDKVSSHPVSKVFGLDRGTSIDRVLIERFLSENSSLIVGDCLEIEDPTYTNKFSQKGSVSHVLKYSPSNSPPKVKEIVADLTKPEDFMEAKFDTLIATQTLNFVFELEPAVQSMHKLLKPGGSALITAAGISQISRYDYDRWGDYWRFTDQSMRKILARDFDPENIQVFTYGNVALSCLFMQGISFEELPDKNLINHVDPEYQMIVCAVARK